MGVSDKVMTSVCRKFPTGYARLVIMVNDQQQGLVLVFCRFSFTSRLIAVGLPIIRCRLRGGGNNLIFNVNRNM